MTNSINRAKKVTVLVIASIVAIMMIMPQAANAMSNDQKAAEKEILTSISNHESKVDVSEYDLTTSELVEVQHDIYYQHPEAFYLAKFRYSVKADGTAVNCMPEYTMSKAAADKGAKQLVKAAKSCKVKGSQAKKVKAIHNWLIKRVTYVKNRTHSHDAYGSLVEKKAVCQGYALAFMMIAKDNGLQCQMVMNAAGTHAWNVVKVGNKWYNVDVTLDDLGKKASKKYLLVADNKLSSKNKKHTGPKCTKTFKW